jgi:hypothetical protein
MATEKSTRSASISESWKRDDVRQKRIDGMTGRTVSEETRAKLSAALKGRIISEEMRAKISASLKGRKLPPRSEEWKANHQKAMRSKAPQSEESKKKTAETMRKRWADPEQRALWLEAHRRVAENRIPKVNSNSYAHTRLGKASLHSCKAVDVGRPPCDKPAREWALLHGVPSVPDKRGAYSKDPSHYIPLCTKCHRNYDGNAKKGWDRDYAGRAAKAVRGEKHGNAKLTDAIVAEIRTRRAGGESVKSLCARFCVSKMTIYRAANNKAWCHVQ